jgi:Fur family zinc uptake transcriptional regulator
MAGDRAHHAGHKGCDHGHDHHSDVTSMVERARRFAASRNVPFTEMRVRVLTVLAREEKPLTAYEIVDRLKGSKKVQAVQVYRALDFLQEAGCIHRLASKASYFACDHEHHPGEAVVFMICSHCGTVQEVPSEAFARGLRSAAKLTGFKPVHPTFEVEGECANCADAFAE